jgi:sarcosine oxidase
MQYLDMTYDQVVIGRGLIGSAAAKYLCRAGAKVALIGPDEETAVREGNVFSSHYDRSRIQRIIGKDQTWTLLNKQSVAEYDAMEKETGIRFHSGQGCLYVNPEGSDSYLENAEQQAEHFHLNFTSFESGGALRSAFPEFHFPAEAKGLFEPAPAGHVDPRLLLRAQLHIFKKEGGAIFNETVQEIHRSKDIFKIKAFSGKEYCSKKVLLAAGAFVNFFDLLKRKLVLNLKSESTIWAGVSRGEAKRLSELPSLLYETSQSDIRNIYLVRPLPYPDGTYYLKMGANTPGDIFFENANQVRDWFKSDHPGKHREALQNALRELMPGLTVETFSLNTCIVAFTQHGKPYIGAADTGLYVAAGGNGYSAMCSDALGKIASAVLTEGAFPKEFPPADFEPVFSS